MEVAPHLSVCLSKGFFIYGIVSALNITLMKSNGTTVRQVSQNMRKVLKFWEWDQKTVFNITELLSGA